MSGKGDHDVPELLPGDVGHGGGVRGVAHRQQHQQLLVGGAAEQGSGTRGNQQGKYTRH